MLALLLLNLIVLPISIVLAALLAWQAIVMGVNFGTGSLLLLCGGGCLAFFGLLAVHELGHLLVGQAVGVPFERFTVGPFQLVREEARVRPRLNTAWFQPAASVVFPRPPDRGRRLRWAAMVLGGPLSNLLVSAACMTAANGHNPGPPREMPEVARAGWREVSLLYPGDLATAWLNVTGLLSFGLGLATLVPGYSTGHRTDGGQLLDLWQGKA